MNLFKDQVVISERIAGKKKHNPLKKSDTKLFVCPKCRQVWEIVRKTNGTRRLVTYTHIPRYGKKREICRGCK
jgi:hypothetical protein